MKKALIFQPIAKSVSFSDEVTVLKLAHKNKIFIPSSCGGMGSCGTCLVHILAGGEMLPAPEDVEQEMAESRQFLPTERLSCQINACDGLIVHIVNNDMLEDDDVYSEDE